MPFKLAVGVKDTVAGRRLGALEGWGTSPPSRLLKGGGRQKVRAARGSSRPLFEGPPAQGLDDVGRSRAEEGGSDGLGDGIGQGFAMGGAGRV